MNNPLLGNPFFLGLLLQKGNSHAQALLRFFTEQALPGRLPETTFLLSAYAEPYETRLLRVHPTWLAEATSQLSNFEKRVMEEPTHHEASWIGNAFKKKIEEKLWLHLAKSRPSLVPFNLCRPDVLIPLTQIPIQHLEKSWFILGLRDLASSFKKIIDARIILLIQSSLSEQEQSILKIYSQEKEVVTFPKMNLAAGLSTKELRDMIFERGINRMAKGFKELGPDALWHFTHYLPKVYGIKLEQLSMSTIPPEISQILFQQAYETVVQGGSP